MKDPSSAADQADLAGQEPGGATRKRHSGRRASVVVLRAVVQSVIAAGILAGAVAGYKSLVASKPEIPTRPPRETVYVVRTAPAVLTTERPTLSLYGEVVAARTVEMRALVAGEIVSLNDNLREGAAVDAGAALVEIDPFAYKGALVEARANLQEARAHLVELEGGVSSARDNVARADEQLTFARRDLERAQQLLSGGSVTERTLDDRRLIVSQRHQQLEQGRNALAVAEAKVEQQRAVIQRLQWRVSQAERNLKDTVLVAPFDAIVRTEAAEAGRLVGVNDVIAILYDRDALEARFTLSDSQYGRLIGESGTLSGREVEVQWHLGTEPVVYRATIDRVGADVASQRGGVDVYARIHGDAAQGALRPGAFVELKVPDRAYENVVRFPETALYNGDHLFVEKDGRLVRRDVAVVAYDGGDVILRGDIASGDRVLLTQIAEAGEGLLVREEGAPVVRGKRPDGKAGDGAKAGGKENAS
ncbi:HlyD family efflux transporter periplasmic adaptor subunit [Breoghania sp. L-A4]|nr:HlyD family efflux transporter periplasmic adaptor subunit [Breoghania sp. L-A4]